jgi:hypothetical protein
MEHTACNAPAPDTPRSHLDERITLSQAARAAPGRPSPNCVWRWCRRGVVARTGQRVRLRHVRIGGKLFTTVKWLDEFGQRLAEADEAYFALPEKEEEAEPRTPRTTARPRTRSRRRETAGMDDRRRDRIRSALQAEGL